MPVHLPLVGDTSTSVLVDDVYRLALGMLWHPDEAQDATQQVFDEAFERLPTVGRQPNLRAWVLGLAAKVVSARRPSFFEQQNWTFDALARDLVRGSDEPLPATAFGTDPLALLEEMKIGCSQTMLLCLDRPLRLAYLLGSFDGLDAEVAAECLGLDEAEFSERLERARALVRDFTHRHCGIVNRLARCRCSHRLGRALVTGRVDPESLLFAGTPARDVLAAS